MTKLKITNDHLDSIISMLPDLTYDQLDKLHDEVFAEYHERNEEPWNNIQIDLDDGCFDEWEEDDNAPDGSL